MPLNDQELGQAQGNSDNSDSKVARNPQHQRARQKWSKTRQNNSFTEKTREMNGPMFQLQLEQKKKGQLQETLDQLQIYSSSNYKKDIKHLKVLFTKLWQPVIVKPKASDSMTKGEQVMFTEQARQYIKDSRSLDTSLASLYNVVWGQCSRQQKKTKVK